MRIILTSIALFFFPLVATATEDRVVAVMSKATGFTEAEIRQHGEKGCESGVQLYMTICALYHYYEKDVELNTTYQTLVSKLKHKSIREDLRTAQRAWVTYRDAECKFNTALWEGGSIRPMENAFCLMRITEERTRQLNDHLNCEGEECPAFNEE
ncbi:hypothetical protein GCM10027343_32400 [Noviherbaspirillum agri]